MYVVRAYVPDYFVERWRRKRFSQGRFSIIEKDVGQYRTPVYYVGTVAGRNMYTADIEEAAQYRWPGHVIADFDLVGRPVKYENCIVEAMERQICG